MRPPRLIWTLAALGMVVLGAPSVGARDLTFEERVRAQEAIERVYHAHQIGSRMPFEDAAPQAVTEDKVRRYLRQSAALERYWATPVTAVMLQRETERMARQSRMPDRLRELFAVLQDDPFLVQECLARPALVDRLARSFFASSAKESWDAWWSEVGPGLDERGVRAVAQEGGSLPEIPAQGTACDPLGTWNAGALDDVPDPRSSNTMVWTGSLMIIWGGSPGRNTGGRYDPATDTWSPTSRVGAPQGRWEHTAVWAGDRMVVWGGSWTNNTWSHVNTGGRYDPVSDTWQPTSTLGAPSPRSNHTAVWTGDRMIIWGGADSQDHLDTGGRYDPATDTWAPTPNLGAPQGRSMHTAVWTGSRMIVWGGYPGGPGYLNTGGRYDPATNSWVPTTLSHAPAARARHTAVWTGSVMIVWGGNLAPQITNTGGRYDPVADQWEGTSTSGAPLHRQNHTAVWTGSRMIVWGGDYVGSPIVDADYLDTGGMYDPILDSWATTPMADAPSARSEHTAVWTGMEMIVWGGSPDSRSGSRYALGPDADCDGSADTVDCAVLDPGSFAVPAEVMQLLVAGDKITLLWDSAGPAAGPETVHDVVAGSTSEFPVGSGAAESCIDQGLSASSTSHAAEPPPGAGFWYLVRARNACGTGTYGTESDGDSRVTTVCP